MTTFKEVLEILKTKDLKIYKVPDPLLKKQLDDLIYWMDEAITKVGYNTSNFYSDEFYEDIEEDMFLTSSLTTEEITSIWSDILLLDDADANPELAQFEVASITEDPTATESQIIDTLEKFKRL